MDDERRLAHYRSKRISRFLSSKHYHTRGEISRLRATDLPKLRRAAAGEVSDATIGDRVKALAAVAAAGTARDCRVFARLVANSEADMRVRAAAAFYLGALPARSAEAALIRNLDVDDTLLRSKVIKSLGRVGGRRSFDALAKLGSGPGFLRRQLRLARAMIAYRTGLDVDPLPFPRRAARSLRRRGDVIDITVRRIRGARVRAALRKLDDAEYGIRLSEDLAFEIGMGRTPLLFVLNRQAVSRGSLAPLTRRRLLTGLVARRMAETGTYSVQYVVLSRPSGKGAAELMMMRNDGVPAIRGTVRLDDGDTSFAFAEVDRSGPTPTRLEGAIGAAGVAVEAGLAYPRRSAKRKTMPVSVPRDSAGSARTRRRLS